MPSNMRGTRDYPKPIFLNVDKNAKPLFIFYVSSMLVYFHGGFC